MKERLVNTKFWSDNWVRKINPLDRYLFIYLLTNEHTNIAGIYELPLSNMAFECGLDERDLEKTMLPRLEPKVYYKDGWVILKNFAKHQHTSSDTVVAGMQKQLNLAPKEVISFAKSIGYAYGMDRVWVRYNILESELESESELEKAAIAAPFSFKEEIQKLEEGKRKDMKIIAYYFQRKGFTYENKEQFNAALKRELRPAKALIGYSKSQIDSAINYCLREYPELWTLETIHKVIDKVK